MLKWAILTFICCILFIVTGIPNLIFLENTKKLVTSIKIIKNGTNLTVSCLIEDLKNKRKSSDLIFWIINDDLRQRSETNAINLYKPGTYYCICNKYKLVRRLHLVVRDEHDFVRRKRSQHQFEAHTITLPINYPDSLRDFSEGPSITTSKENNVNNYVDKYLANLREGSIVRNNNNSNPNYRDNVHSIHQGIPMGTHTAIPPTNYPDSVRDIHEGLSKTTSTTNNYNNVNGYIDKSLANSGGGSIVSNNNSYDPNYRDNLPSIYQGIPRKPHTDIPPRNYPDLVKDIFEGSSNTTLKPSNKNVSDDVDTHLEKSGGGSIVSNNNDQNPNYSNTVHRIHEDSNNDQSRGTVYYVPQHRLNVTYFFAIVLVVVIVSLLIYFLSKRRNRPVTQARTNDNSAAVTSNTNNQIEYCGHIYCERYRNFNSEISCYLETFHSSGLISTSISTFNHDDAGVTALTDLIVNNNTVDSSSARPYSDSPPVYRISNRNSPLHSTQDVPNEFDLPPSYYQAVANMHLYPPPNLDFSVDEMPLSTISTSLPNVTRTRPLEHP